ncbi:zinc chelation protein SecC [Neisseria meningitidis]|uniref:Putative membrane protein n=1 Tax=Neisseria meningitidis serogroup B / serotype 15 (strain H44/76) TaxID=909420 RepID=E6MZ16_NEIMH|nr:zinc chelation protein SecC [Neisseria meningitidis LNP21362]ARC07652.1 zinc chelation protein SecC [Neisseria meningitidis]EFV63037.1 putative membrane protein [Neisseria meningitidis H44/76]MBG8614442.1 zinc chelation protein SecC [Neisseria meningitidis]MBG8623962.1 zinc chelation protein SecC [Neisseria meningitidis]
MYCLRLRCLVLIFVNPLYNVGIGGGALLGHWVTQYSGISCIGVAGMLTAAAGLWVCLNLNRHIRT